MSNAGSATELFSGYVVSANIGNREVVAVPRQPYYDKDGNEVVAMTTVAPGNGNGNQTQNGNQNQNQNQNVNVNVQVVEPSDPVALLGLTEI